MGNSYYESYYGYPYSCSNVSYPYQIISQNADYQVHYSPSYDNMGYFSPQPNFNSQIEGFQDIKFNASGAKPKIKSKLSTKSPHAITGHKLGKANSFETSKSLNKGTDSSQALKISPAGQANTVTNMPKSGSFNQHSAQYGRSQIKNGSESWNDTAAPSVNESQNSYFRKSTYDCTENTMINSSPLSPYSIQDHRYSNSFKANPFPLNKIDENYTDSLGNSYGQQPINDEQHFSDIHNDDYDQIFDVFTPFTNDTFKNYGNMDDSSSGPIFSLISGANQDSSN